MAAVVTIEEVLELGGTKNLYIGTVAMDSSYPTGGEPIDGTKNERFERLIATPAGTAATGTGYKPEFDIAGQKLLMLYGDNDNAADGVLIEVPNATDLSAITKMPFVAVGA